MASLLITARDIAQRDRMGSVGAWVRAYSSQFRKKGVIPAQWDGHSVSGATVEGLVNKGRWVAICPTCGNVEYVDPDEPIFYCLRCANGGSPAARPVQFPEDRDRIERALIARPVVETGGHNAITRALMAVPEIAGLGRDWHPGITAVSLEKQNKKAKL